MSTNYEYLIKDFDECNFFTDKFKNFKFIEKNKYLKTLSEIAIEKVNTLSNLNLNINTISELHKFIPDEMMEYDLTFGVNKYSSNFYDMSNEFKITYLKMLKKIRDNLDFNFYFQENPTLRVQLPHPTSKLFYPFFHSDVQLGHPPYEINLWFPLSPPSIDEGHGFTLCDLEKSISYFKEVDYNFDYLKENKEIVSNILSCFSEDIKFDFGSLLFFDTRCFHSTLPLINHSRLSVDVRIMPTYIYDKFSHEYMGSGRRKVIFKPGGGYSINSIDDLKL